MNHRPLSIVYRPFHFHHDRLLCIRKRKRRPVMGGEHIDAAAAVDAVLVRFIPGALWDIDHAGKNAWREAAWQDDRAAVVVDFDFVAVFDAARFRIDGVDEDTLREGFLEPVVVVVRGVNAMESVMTDGL